MIRRGLKILMLAAVLFLAPFHGGPHAQGLVADSSSQLVAITTGFVGTDVLLFGAIESPGDIIIVVRGPARREVVRRKGRHAGIWINEMEASFHDVPSYYWLASSKPIETLLRPASLKRHGIGAQNLPFVAMGKVAPDDLAGFRAGLIRNKVFNGLYTVRPRDVSFRGQHLFRSTVYFPSNVPTGAYKVRVFFVRDGRVISAQTVPLTIAKIGLGADVYRFAHASSALYGLLAIAIALFVGLFAGVIFRKV
jgi:uncharacterized protein (TIGR02186 family)